MGKVKDPTITMEEIADVYNHLKSKRDTPLSQRDINRIRNDISKLERDITEGKGSDRIIRQLEDNERILVDGLFD